jgi:DNA adenine methylase
VYAFWKSVLEHTDELCKLIQDTPVTMDEWYCRKSVQLKPCDYSILELGFSTFFLNRTNRSGILKGGVIGGKGQSGKWKIDARFNKEDLVARIQRIARYSNRISVYNCDAAEFIRSHLPNLPRHSLVYLDPPYYVKGEGLYEDHYIHDDHVKIAKLVASRIKQPWIVSYDNTPEITKIYKGFRTVRYDLSYSAQERYAGSEIMFFSKNLAVPEVKNPAHVKLHAALMPVLL